ncbi:MAG: aldo/keto reductase [Planctomycetota bacterium]
MDSCQSVTVGQAQMPSVGLGLWKIENAQTAEMVYEAIKQGYRHLDSACDYGNEKEAGEGIARAIGDGLCTREELWITSKLWNTFHRAEHAPAAMEKTLTDLGLDYLDLYLVHFPIALKHVPIEERYPPGWFFDPDAENPCLEADVVPIAETWQAMEALYAEGNAKHIGVCNFGTSLLRDLLSYAKVPPTVLQVESHPQLVQAKLVRFCQEHNIAYTAFSPLGSSSYVELGMATEGDSLLGNQAVGEIASKHERTPAQVLLRWGVQRGTAVIPKTSRKDRLAENLSVFDFELSEEEMSTISAMDAGRRFNDPGVFCDQAFGTFFPIYE